MVELGIFSAMWSEHCSYKSSKVWLKKLPTKAPWVIQGPGENAGVIDIGDGQAAIFKMESHNHPSYIEPYQGAATGVGGILRDVFTMGARPIANINALRFGDPSHPKTRHLVSGVVAGIGGYGNCMGIPTVGGETNFHAAYNGNILVNAMTVGVASQRPHLLCGGRRRRQSAGLCRLQDRPRRHPWRDHGLDRIQRGQRGEAADGAGRRPVRREAAARGLPRADGDRRHRRHPGHGRGRPHLLVVRDGGQGRPRRRGRARQGAAARDRHDPLRAHALREPGAHADRAQARPRGARPQDLREVGARLRGDRPSHRHRAHGADLARRHRRQHPDPAAGHRGADVRAAVDADPAAARARGLGGAGAGRLERLR